MKAIQKSVLALALGLICLTAPAMAISEKYRSQSENLLAQAAAAFAAEQIQQADDLVNLALTANPANAAAFILKGQIHAANGDTAEALRIVTVGLAIEPANLPAIALQIELAVEIERFEQADEALATYEKICLDDCGQVEPLRRLIDDNRAADAKVEVKSQKE